MSDLKSFEKLAEKARRDECPAIDVAHRVLREIRSRASQPAADHMGTDTLFRFAVLSLAPAIVVLAVTLPRLSVLYDPLSAVMQIAGSIIP